MRSVSRGRIAHYTDFEVDPRDGSLYFTTSIYGAFIGHLSSLGAELARTGFAEHNDSLAVDLEDSAVWVAEMPRVDDDLALIAPMNLRKLDSALQSLLVVPFPGVIKVIGAVPATPTTLEISLEIQPQDAHHVVSLVGNTEVRAALLSSAGFDPLQMDLRTIRFGTAGAVVRSSWTRDVNGDGVADLVTTFATRHTGIKCGDTSAPLTGETHGGVSVHGTGTLRTKCR